MNSIKVSPGAMIADDECILLTGDFIIIARKGNIGAPKILLSTTRAIEMEIQEKGTEEVTRCILPERS